MDAVYENPFVTLRMEDEIAYMELHNEKFNKVESADFIDLNVLKEWISENKPIGLVIYGKGRHFSAGADLEYLSRKKESKETFISKLTKGKEVLDYIEQLPIITVAAISGSCCGAGLEIALSCQFRVATESSVFAFPEASLGVMPGMGGTIRLPQLIGKTKAIKMILTAERLYSEDALKIGLIDCVAEKGNHILCAADMIKKLTDEKSYLQVISIIKSIKERSQETETQLFTDFLKVKEIVT